MENEYRLKIGLIMDKKLAGKQFYDTQYCWARLHDAMGLAEKGLYDLAIAHLNMIKFKKRGWYE